MSARGPRRRRRRSRGGSSLAGDPLDLFLDAITNALGVIMFILLMVVLFGRADEVPSPAKSIAEARRLQEEVERLAREVESLPPAGDPEMERRLREALERIAAAERATAAARPEAERAAREAAEAVAREQESRRELERLATKLEVLAKAIRPPGGFIRLSRLDTSDRRAPEFLGIAAGRIDKLPVTAATTEVRAPEGGIQVRDAAGAGAAVRTLLEGVDPKARRIELLVWQGSFREGRLVEEALIEAGFGLNAMPIEAGKALGRAEKGGVQ